MGWTSAELAGRLGFVSTSEGAASAVWRLELSWDGRDFVGWQRQPEGRSIQGEVEGALSRVLGGRRVSVTASGRTDAGVHAAHQVASFRGPPGLDHHKLRRSLDAVFPPDLACLAVAPAGDQFHARHCTVRKTYRYRVLRRPARCPFRQGHVWHRTEALDLAGMAAGAALVVGTHDFSSFRAARCGASSPVRRIEAVRVRPSEDELWLEFVGHGFLRHQVRIMVGTLLALGRQGADPAEMGRILTLRDRSAAGDTAPARGLWLMAVETVPEPVLRGGKPP